ARRSIAAAQRSPPLDALGPGVLLADVVTEGTGGITHGGLGPVGDDVGHLRGVRPAIAFVDVLDDLFAATGLDVEVDVRRSGTTRGEEPLEQQPVLDGVHGGDAEGEADGGVRGGTPPLAEDATAATEVDDLV